MSYVSIFYFIELDDKKLNSVLKKMNLNTLNGIEEVNIFKNNGEVIHITNPKSKFITKLMTMNV